MQRWMIARPAAASLCAFAAAYLLMFLALDLRINMFDEGLVLVNALRTMRGDVDHRDYYSPYAPASYYLLAGLFSIGRYHFLIARLYGIAWMAGIVALNFRLLADRVRPAITLGVTLVCAAWMIALPFYLYPTFPCLFLILLGTLLLLRWSERRRAIDLFLAGCTAGAATLFRYDSGAFELVAHLLALAVLVSLDAAPGLKVASFARFASVYCLGTAVIFLPFAVMYLSIAPLSGFWSDIIDYGLHYYAAMRGLPFPRAQLLHHPGDIGIYVPFMAVVLGAVAIGRVHLAARRRHPPLSPQRPDRETVFLIVMTALTAILIYKGTVRVSLEQMIMAIIPANLLIACVGERAWRGPIGARIVMALVFLLAAFPATYKLGAQMTHVYREGASMLGRLTASSDTPANAGCHSRPAVALAIQTPEYQATTDYLRRATKPQEPIFVALDRHDMTLANPVSLYFLADRRPGTHWHEFDPGMQTRADIQRKMIADLVRNRVRWIVRDPNFTGAPEANLSAVSSGVHLLDAFIAAHYRRVARLGKIEMWLLNGEDAPPAPSGTSCSPG